MKSKYDMIKCLIFLVHCVPHHWTLCLQTWTNVKRGRTPALTAATTRRAPSSACAMPPTSWGLMGNSVTVSAPLFPHQQTQFCKGLQLRWLRCLTVCKWRSLSPWRHVSGIEMEIVNSCENNNGGCSHHCQHSASGPICSCNQGYQLDHDLRTCIGRRLSCANQPGDWTSSDISKLVNKCRFVF